MAWTRYLEMVINLGGRGLDTLLRNPTAVTTLKASDIVQNDEFPLRLRFVLPTNDSGNPLEVVQLADGSIIVFSGKQTSALSGSTLLYYCGDFTEHQDDAGYYYEGILNTNTTETAAAFAALASGKTTIEVINEVEIQNADNSQRTSYQHNGIFRRQVYNGEGAQTSAEPPYPLASSLVAMKSFLDAALVVGQAYVDFTIPAGCTRFGQLGVRRPSADADAIVGESLYLLDDTTLRLDLNAAPTVEGYIASIFARVAPETPSEAELVASARISGALVVDQAYVDFTIPTGTRDIIPMGVQMPDDATDDDALTLVSARRTSASTARGYLNAAPTRAGYTAFLFTPLQA